MLYWFRSPPDVKVGRAALAPDVIRDIENSNPSLRFDWDKILTVKPPPPPDPGREEREERRNRQRQSTEARQPTPSARSGRAGPGGAALAVSAASIPPGVETPLPREPGVEGAGDSVLVESAAVSPVESGTAEPLRHIALAVTDEEGLARLRARHAEIQTRIGDRFRDPARLEELRAQAADLDPDGWRTVDEARERIASLYATTAALRKILGRRRRSRRGGARRPGRVPDGATKSGEVGAAETAESAPPAPPSADGASDGDAT